MLKTILSFSTCFIFLLSSSQTVDFDLQCTGLQEIKECIEVSDGYYLKKLGKNPGYYKTDKNFKVLKFFPCKDVDGVIENEPQKYQEFGGTLFITGAMENKKQGTLDFYRFTLENPNDVKVFHSEKAKLKGQKGWKCLELPKEAGDASMFPSFFLKYSLSANRQRLFMIWIDPNSTVLNYHIYEFDTSFNLIYKHIAETGQKHLQGSEFGFECKTLDNGALLFIYNEEKTHRLFCTLYQPDSKKTENKILDAPAGFIMPSTEIDIKHNKLCILYDANMESLSPGREAELNLAADIVRFHVYDLPSLEKTIDLGVKLTKDQIDSLQVGGNLKRKLTDPAYIAAKDCQVFDNGNYGLVFDLGNYIDYSSTRDRPVAAGTMTISTTTSHIMKGDNNYIAMIYNPSSQQMERRSLYRTRGRAGLVSRIYFFDNRFSIFCETKRSGDDIREEPPKEKKYLTGYQIDENGKVKNIRYLMDKAIDFEMGLWDNITGPLIALHDKANEHALCLLKLKK